MRDGIVIGEGVVLDARPASFVTRALAIAIDLAIMFVVIIGVIFMMGSLSSAGVDWIDEVLYDYGAAIAIILVVMILVGIPTTVETLWRGRSVGKLALGIRIVRDDGGPVRFRHALIRALVGVLELWISLGGIALIASLSNDKGKRLGDIVAGTYAIRVRGGRSTIAPVQMPPHLAAWASHADMRRLPDGLALAARQFLARVRKLNPQSRARVGLDLAARMERYVAPGPPLGTPPEVFLAAVLAERRRRDAANLLRSGQVAAAQGALLHRLPYSIPDPQ